MTRRANILVSLAFVAGATVLSYFGYPWLQDGFNLSTLAMMVIVASYSIMVCIIACAIVLGLEERRLNRERAARERRLQVEANLWRLR